MEKMRWCINGSCSYSIPCHTLFNRRCSSTMWWIPGLERIRVSIIAELRIIAWQHEPYMSILTVVNLSWEPKTTCFKGEVAAHAGIKWQRRCISPPLFILSENGWKRSDQRDDFGKTKIPSLMMRRIKMICGRGDIALPLSVSSRAKDFAPFGLQMFLP